MNSDNAFLNSLIRLLPFQTRFGDQVGAARS